MVSRVSQSYLPKQGPSTALQALQTGKVNQHGPAAGQQRRHQSWKSKRRTLEVSIKRACNLQMLNSFPGSPHFLHLLTLQIEMVKTLGFRQLRKQFLCLGLASTSELTFWTFWMRNSRLSSSFTLALATLRPWQFSIVFNCEADLQWAMDLVVQRFHKLMDFSQILPFCQSYLMFWTSTSWRFSMCSMEPLDYLAAEHGFGSPNANLCENAWACSKRAKHGKMSHCKKRNFILNNLTLQWSVYTL